MELNTETTQEATTMTQKLGCFGWSNVITITILVVSLTGFAVTMSNKLDNIAQSLQEEVIERKLEDEKIRMELDRRWEENTNDHRMIMESLGGLRGDIGTMNENLMFHLGQHQWVDGKEK